MATEGPQLVIELFAGTEDSPPRITIRSSADAPTTIVPASVEDASETDAPARKKKAARKKKGAKKRAARRKAAARAQDDSEAAAKAVPANGRRKKAGKKKAAKKKAGKRGREPYPDRQTLKATDGEATAELFRLDKKWYLNVDGTEVGDGSGWTSRKQALEAATEVLGEFEVAS